MLTRIPISTGLLAVLGQVCRNFPSLLFPFSSSYLIFPRFRIPGNRDEIPPRPNPLSVRGVSLFGLSIPKKYVQTSIRLGLGHRAEFRQ